MASDFYIKTGLQIESTTDAKSSTVGGSLTTNGGAAIAKKLFVGDDVNVSGKLKINPSTNLLTPANGTIEYDGINLYFTPNSNDRKTLLFREDTIPVINIENPTISGVTLGNNLYGLSAGKGLIYISGNAYNGSSTSVISIDETVVLKSDLKALIDKNEELEARIIALENK